MRVFFARGAYTKREVIDMIRTKSLFSCRVPHLESLFKKCEYPWQILDSLSAHIEELLENPPNGFSWYSEGVLIGEGVKIDTGARVLPPAIIGAGTEIRQGAFIRGGVVCGEGCVIGNSSELKNCVLLDKVQVPHYNYVGDSVLGNGAHLGAGVICSNLKGDKSEVVIHAQEEHKTGRRKVGAFVGDGAEVGCSCVLNPGTVIGTGSRIYPLISVRGVVEAGTLVKK